MPRPICDAIKRLDVRDCRRLIATRARGSACWLYAGVTLRELPTPSVWTSDMIATALVTACLELLQVGLDVGSASIVEEAAVSLMGIFVLSEGTAALVYSGIFYSGGPLDGGVAPRVISALTTALNDFGCDAYICQRACAVFGMIATHVAGHSLLCAADTTIPLLISVLRNHQDDAFVLECAFDCVGRLANNSFSSVDAFVRLGAVHLIVEGFRHKMTSPPTRSYELSLQSPFAFALSKLSAYSVGQRACCNAGAEGLLSFCHSVGCAFASEALTNMGYVMDTAWRLARPWEVLK